DLKRRILDCPGGAASAVAEISADGGTAVAVDPEYALGADELRARVLADLDRSVLYTRERDDQFDWDVRGGVVGHEAVRRAAAARCPRCPSPRTPRTWPCAPICCSPTPTGSTRPITSPRSSRWPAWPPRSASTRWSTTGARPSPSSSAR